MCTVPSGFGYVTFGAGGPSERLDLYRSVRPSPRLHVSVSPHVLLVSRSSYSYTVLQSNVCAPGAGLSDHKRPPPKDKAGRRHMVPDPVRDRFDDGAELLGRGYASSLPTMFHLSKHSVITGRSPLTLCPLHLDMHLTLRCWPALLAGCTVRPSF